MKLSGVLSSNRDGSYETQTARKYVLTQAGSDLNTLGFRVSNPLAMKAKHVHFLLDHWKDKSLTNSTIKNRMSHLRWLEKKTGLQFMQSGCFLSALIYNSLIQ